MKTWRALSAMVYNRVDDRQLGGAKWRFAAKRQRAASSEEASLLIRTTVAEESVLGHMVHWLDFPGTKLAAECDVCGAVPERSA